MRPRRGGPKSIEHRQSRVGKNIVRSLPDENRPGEEPKWRSQAYLAEQVLRRFCRSTIVGQDFGKAEIVRRRHFVSSTGRDLAKAGYSAIGSYHLFAHLSSALFYEDFFKDDSLVGHYGVSATLLTMPVYLGGLNLSLGNAVLGLPAKPYGKSLIYRPFYSGCLWLKNP